NLKKLATWLWKAKKPMAFYFKFLQRLTKRSWQLSHSFLSTVCEKRIISSLFSIIYRFSLFFGKGTVSKMVKSGNVANISYLMI
ncbi:hypothetical protein Q3F77_07715, partial [Enterococcus faecium]|nr:hypothetical protein [Enterococcus faecium]